MLQVRSMEGVDCSRLRLYPVDNPLSSRVNRLVNAVRSQRPHLLQSVRVLVAKDPLEARFLSMLTGLYLPDTSPISRLYLAYISPTSRRRASSRCSPTTAHKPP